MKLQDVSRDGLRVSLVFSTSKVNSYTGFNFSAETVERAIAFSTWATEALRRENEEHVQAYGVRGALDDIRNALETLEGYL